MRNDSVASVWVVETFRQYFPGDRIPGILPPAKPPGETEESDFDKVLAVDLRGVFLWLKYEIRQMLKACSGVNVKTARWLE